MKLQPVPRSETPGYPTGEEVAAEQELLERSWPRGWRFGKDITSAATVLLAANLTGCGDSQAAPPSETKIAQGNEQCTTQVASTAGTVVAPIFEHGTGRGMTGCIVMNPPVFLSEEEAMQVIKEELGRHGIELEANVKLRDVEVVPPLEEWQEDTRTMRIVEDRSLAEPLTVDGLDELNKVAVEYVSDDDYLATVPYSVDENGVKWSSWFGRYDVKSAAESLAKQIRRQSKRKLYAGLFYDPMVRWDFGDPDGDTPFEKLLDSCNEESKRLLRLQAQDFVAWLKKEKAL